MELEKIYKLIDEGYSITEIAGRGHISPSTIWKWMSGKAIPSYKMTLKINKGITDHFNKMLDIMK